MLYWQGKGYLWMAVLDGCGVEELLVVSQPSRTCASASGSSGGESRRRSAPCQALRTAPWCGYHLY